MSEQKFDPAVATLAAEILRGEGFLTPQAAAMTYYRVLDELIDESESRAAKQEAA